MTRYVVTFAALLALTAATLVLSFAPLGAFHIPVALAIAVAKSVLIALVFMHLAEQRHSNAVAFLISVVMAAVFIGLAVLDVVSRGPSVFPPR
jgi:cytochrome c oxidase subunit 4